MNLEEINRATIDWPHVQTKTFMCISPLNYYTYSRISFSWSQFADKTEAQGVDWLGKVNNTYKQKFGASSLIPKPDA